jgi:Zn-dependent peptidase ImmA (M78 family)
MKANAVDKKRRNLQREILRKYARSLTYAVGTYEPPYDPWRVATHLGVSVQTKALTGMDGYVDLTDGEPKIFVASNCSHDRQRFTLAHEIGHVLLIHAFRDGKRPLTYGLRRYRMREIPTDFSSDPTEERLCNYFAAELLMPRSDVMSFTRGRAPRLGMIVSLAQLFRVSLQAAARRLFDVWILNSAVSLWARHPWPTRRWVVGKMAGDVQKNVALLLQKPPAYSVFDLRHRGHDLKAEVLPLSNEDLALVSVMDAADCQIPGQMSLPGM